MNKPSFFVLLSYGEFFNGDRGFDLLTLVVYFTQLLPYGGATNWAKWQGNEIGLNGREKK